MNWEEVSKGQDGSWNHKGSRKPSWGREERQKINTDFLIEEAVKWLGRNQVPEKFSGIHKDDPAKTPRSSGEGVLYGLPL